MPDPDHAPSWPLADHPDPAAAALGEALREAYAAPTRRYHDLRHLTEVLAALDDLAAHGVVFDPLPVLLAAWFHDGVYDGERDAEERSATWAEQALRGLVDDAVVTEVARLVRLTETHRPEPDDPDGAALSDADLAILAREPERYAEYAGCVREEYAHVDDADFAAGRAAVLEELLDAPWLYATPPARERWERPARANLEAELARLRPDLAARTG